MKIDTIIQRNIILLLVLILFLFCFIYYYMNFTEGFGDYDLSKIRIQTDLNANNYYQRGNLSVFNKWNSQYVTVPFTDFLSGNAIVETGKNNEFTVSFWLFLHELKNEQVNIFELTENNNSSLYYGITLYPEASYLVIKQRDESGNMIYDFVSISLNKAEHYSFVFSSNNITVYINGILRTPQYNFMRKGGWKVIDGGNVFCKFGDLDDSNTYVIFDLKFHSNKLMNISGNREIELSFKTSKEKIEKIYKSIEKAEEDAMNTFEGFTSLIENTFVVEDGNNQLSRWSNSLNTFTLFNGKEENVENFENRTAELNGIYDFYAQTMMKEVSQPTMLGNYVIDTVNSRNNKMVIEDTVILYREFDSMDKNFMTIKLDEDISGETGMTFAFWLYAKGDGVIFEMGNSSDEKTNDNIGSSIDNSSLTFFVGNKDGNFKFDYVGISENIWNHIIWTIDEVNKEWKIFVNSKKAKTKTNSSNFIYPSVNNEDGTSYKRSNMTIGKSSGKNIYFDGKIADFRIINRSVNNDEVRSIYDLPKRG